MTSFIPHPAIDCFIAKLGSRILPENDPALMGHYNVYYDTVYIGTEGDADHHYSALLHEHIHWTGHPSRLDRNFGQSKNDLAYGVEELTAIFGSIELCAQFRLGVKAAASELRYALTFLPRMREAAVMADAQRQAKRAVAYLYRLAGASGAQPSFRSTAALGAMVLTKADAIQPQPAQAALAHLKARYGLGLRATR